MELPPAARRSLAELLAWEADRHNLYPQGTHTYRNPETGTRRKLPYIAGHRDAGYTECPGNFVYAALPAIRRDTKAAMGAGKISTQLTLTPSTPVIRYRESATFTGFLTDEAGSPMPARPIRSYVKVPGATWTAGPGTITATDGSYSLTITPKQNSKVIAIYDGDTTTWGADSNVAAVKVRPEVTLQAEGGTVDAAGWYRFPSGTTTVPLSGNVRPRHAGYPVVLRVSKMNVDGTYTLLSRLELTLDDTSAYRIDYLLPQPSGGTYRAVTWFPGDSDHPSSPSPAVNFVVDP